MNADVAIQPSRDDDAGITVGAAELAVEGEGLSRDENGRYVNERRP